VCRECGWGSRREIKGKRVHLGELFNHFKAQHIDKYLDMPLRCLQSGSAEVLYNHVVFFEKEGKSSLLPDDWVRIKEERAKKMREKGITSKRTQKIKKESIVMSKKRSRETGDMEGSEPAEKRFKEDDDEYWVGRGEGGGEQEGKGEQEQEREREQEGEEEEEAEGEGEGEGKGKGEGGGRGRGGGGGGGGGGCLNCGELKRKRVRRKKDFLSDEKFQELVSVVRARIEECEKNKQTDVWINGAKQYLIPKEKLAFMHMDIMSWIAEEGFQDPDYVDCAILVSVTDQVFFLLLFISIVD
jgi:hypothetical protein